MADSKKLAALHWALLDLVDFAHEFYLYMMGRGWVRPPAVAWVNNMPGYITDLAAKIRAVPLADAVLIQSGQELDAAFEAMGAPLRLIVHWFPKHPDGYARMMNQHESPIGKPEFDAMVSPKVWETWAMNVGPLYAAILKLRQASPELERPSNVPRARTWKAHCDKLWGIESWALVRTQRIAAHQAWPADFQRQWHDLRERYRAAKVTPEFLKVSIDDYLAMMDKNTSRNCPTKAYAQIHEQEQQHFRVSNGMAVVDFAAEARSLDLVVNLVLPDGEAATADQTRKYLQAVRECCVRRIEKQKTGIPKQPKTTRKTHEHGLTEKQSKVVELWGKHHGKLAAVARELNIKHTSVIDRIAGANKKLPLDARIRLPAKKTPGKSKRRQALPTDARGQSSVGQLDSSLERLQNDDSL